jgi:hypothetical protein
MAQPLHSWKRRLRTAEAADYLGCTIATLRSWRLRGSDDPNPGPPFIRLSPTLIVYDLDALDEYLAQKRAATFTAAQPGYAA